MNRLRYWWEAFTHEIKRIAGPPWADFLKAVRPRDPKDLRRRRNFRVIEGGKK